MFLQKSELGKGKEMRGVLFGQNVSPVKHVSFLVVAVSEIMHFSIEFFRLSLSPQASVSDECV